MKTRRLGKTELQVSEIGFGGEWLERHPEEESIELIHYASSKGINISLASFSFNPEAYVLNGIHIIHIIMIKIFFIF